MNIAEGIRLLSNGRSLATVKSEIRDELDFHVLAIQDELIADGMNPVDAASEAEKRFGSKRRIAEECHRIQTGSLVWLTRASVVVALLLLAVVAGLTWSIIQLRDHNALLMSQLRIASLPPAEGASMASLILSDAEEEVDSVLDKLDVKGKVLTAEGKPIEKAKVFLIHKSWPDRRFQMENDVTESDREGAFVFQNVYSNDSEHEFLVSIQADGYEMRSEYVSLKTKKKLNAFDFKLKPARTIQFQVLNQDGSVLADTDVALLSRKSGTKEQSIYAASARDAKITTDQKGMLKISMLNVGDAATFGVFIFDEIHNVELKVTKDENQLIVVSSKK